MKTHLAAIMTGLALVGVGCDADSPPARSNGTPPGTATAASEVERTRAGLTQVEVARIANQDLEQEFTGLVHGYEQAELFGRVEGFVSDVSVDIGDEVDSKSVMVDAPHLAWVIRWRPFGGSSSVSLWWT